jgi:hypothetical protein
MVATDPEMRASLRRRRAVEHPFCLLPFAFASLFCHEQNDSNKAKSKVQKAKGKVEIRQG